MTSEVIFSYSQAEVLADGGVIDVSGIACEAGFTLPLAVSDNLYHSYIMPSLDLAKEGQSPSGRLWDTLSVLRYAIKASPATDRITFTVLFTMAPSTEPVPVELLAVCGPDDSGAIVITVMLPTDD